MPSGGAWALSWAAISCPTEGIVEALEGRPESAGKAVLIRPAVDLDRFDPEAVQALKAETTTNLTIGGANLAARAFEAGLVDECRLFVWPMILGGGKSALPAGLRSDLELLDEHRFGNGVVHLRYRVST